MTYKGYQTRNIIENYGNTTLYAENSGEIYILEDNRKIYFTYAPAVNTGQIGDFKTNNGGAHSNQFDIFAVEKIDNIYKLVLRNRLDGNNNLKDPNTNLDQGNIYFSIRLFNDRGESLWETELAPDGNESHYYEVIDSRKAIKSLVGPNLLSPLEKWAITNTKLREEYNSSTQSRVIMPEIPNLVPGGLSSFPYKNLGRLEDWAYNKYVELYPREKVPSTYGIEGNYPSAENAYYGKKTLTGYFRDYKFYNRGSGKYEIKTNSGFDEITGMTLEFTDKTIDVVDDIKGVFNQVTGLNTDSGKMFRLYNAAFARFPDTSGLKYWIGNFSSGKDDERAVASSFLASSEFQERYGDNVSNSQYVETLYINVLGRGYDQSGYKYWLGNLNNGLETRHELLLGFAESAENKTLFTEMTGFA